MRTVFLILVLPTFLFAGEVTFTANKKQDSQATGQVTMGKIKLSPTATSEMPAGELGDGTLIVKMSKAKTFAEAMRICQQLVPVGKWQVPSSMAANLWAASIDPDMAIESGDRNSGAIFPIWTYNDITDPNQKAALSKKAVAYAFRGGEAFEAFEIDLAAKKVNRGKRDPLPKALETKLFEKLENGLTTYCELEPKANTPAVQVQPARGTTNPAGATMPSSHR